MYISLLGGLNLGIHELGHLVFSPFGTFISILGGTFFQVSAPVISILNFYRQNDFFAISICFGWLSINFFEVSRYLADAQAMNLPLVSAMGALNPIHDWNYILSRMNILQYDAALAFTLICAAVISMIICFILGSWLLWLMLKNPS